MKKRLLGIILLISTTVFSKEISLKEVLIQANENNKSIKEQKLETKNDELDLKKAKIKKLPSLDWSSNLNKKEETDNDSYSNSITLSQPLYKGGSIVNGIKKAEYQKKLSNLELNDTINDITLEVTEYYIDGLKYQNQLEVYKKSLEELKTQYQKKKLLYNNKMLSKSDLLDIESDIIKTESNIIETNNNYKISIEKLKNAISYKDDEEITLKKLDVKISNIDFNNDLNKAISSNSDILIAELSKLIAKTEVNIEKSDLLPNVSLTFTYGSSDDDIADSLNDFEWKVGISLSQNLYDWGDTKKTIQQSKNNYVIEELAKEQTMDEVKLNLKTKYYALQAYEKQIEAQEKLINAKEESYKINKIKFESKYLDTNDYLESETELTESKLDLIDLESEYYLTYHEYLNLVNAN